MVDRGADRALSSPMFLHVDSRPKVVPPAGSFGATSRLVFARLYANCKASNGALVEERTGCWLSTGPGDPQSVLSMPPIKTSSAAAQRWPVLGCESLESRVLLASDLQFTEPPSGEQREAIIGGQLSLPNAWPWMVSVQNDLFGRNVHACGGALIAPDAVLTAAHCVEGESVSELSARIGGGDLDSTAARRAPIGEIIIHPDYESFTNDADIAVLLLETPVESPTLQYLRSGDADLARTEAQATVLGWGAVRQGGTLQNGLREMTVPIVANSVANGPFAYDGQVTPRMIAAGFAEGGRDSCQGDSGGPMIVADPDGQPHLGGIVSWGEGCALPNKFGIYTRVSSFADWIDGIVGVGPAGFVNFTQQRYADGSQAAIRLEDADLASVESFDVVVTSDIGDRETVRLTAFDEGRFEGRVEIAISEVVAENQILNVRGGESIRVVYQDLDDGNGNSTLVSDSSLIVEDDFSNTRDDTLQLVPPVQIRGEIDVSRDTDWFGFEVEVGSAYEINVLLDGSLNDSLVAVYDEDGTTVLGFDDDGGRGRGSQLLFVPSRPGQRYIEVSGVESNVGTYLLEIIEVTPPADDHANGPDGATSLAFADVVSGEIDLSSDSDWFVFEAEEGARYDIDAAPGTLIDTQLRLYDTDGRTELAYNDDATVFTFASRIHWQAPESATYFVELSGVQGATGSYEFAISESTDDHANTIDGATRMDASIEVAREFGLVGGMDVDWFVFSAQADQFYEIRTSPRSLQDSILTLYDSAGETALAVNDDHLGSTMSRIVWQAGVTDDYFVEVAAFDQGRGDYELTIRELGLPPVDDFGNRADLASSIAPNETARGSIQYESDFDWFSFESVPGRTYTIEVELDTLSDSLLKLYDADGRSLIDLNDDINTAGMPPNRASRLEWIADSTGLHFIEVSGFDGERGRYGLSLSVDTDPFDLNRDGAIDDLDIDFLFAAIREEPQQPNFDLDMSGSVDAADIDPLLARIGTLFGDADLDSIVGFSDFLTLSEAFSHEGGWSQGDFDGSGRVDFDDYLTLLNRFGETA